MEPTPEASPLLRARIAGVFYLLTIVTGTLALVFASARLVLTLVPTACYVMVTMLFYGIFKPVNKGLSLFAACVGLVGCAFGALGVFQLAPLHINSLAFFGLHCLLVGYLIIRSTFLPWILGPLMAFGGLGWLTFASPSLASHLAPYNMAPGALGETALTLWLLAMGVNVQRWREQAGGGRAF